MAIELAPLRLYQLVREFALRAPDYIERIVYETKPDERYDMTLVSQRVYKNRDEGLVIQAAAGIDSPETVLEEQTLVLPPPSVLRQMKQQAGFDLSARR